MFVSHLAVSDSRCTIQTSGCNFRCTGCFSAARNICGKNLTPDDIIEAVNTHASEPAPGIRSCKPDKQNKIDVLIAGGEPTLYGDELIELIRGLGGRRVTLATNGHLLDADMIEKLPPCRVHINLKALTPSIHTQYTGVGNENVCNAIHLLYEHSFDMEVETVYIPDVVEADEIERIAQFLSEIDTHIPFKIIRYIPANGFSRRPKRQEIERAVGVASGYLKNVISSIDSRSHPRSRRIISFSHIR